MKQLLLSLIAGSLGGVIATLAISFFPPAPTGQVPAASVGAPATLRPWKPTTPLGDEIFRSMAQFAAAAGTTTEAAESPPASQTVPPWQAQINSLIDTLPPQESVKQIAALLPSLPPEAQEEAAWRIDSMIFEEDYEVAANLLRNPSTPPQAWKVLFEGLHRRQDEVRLPVLADLAATHPLGESARAELRDFFGYDASYSPPSWHERVAHHFSPQNIAIPVE